MRDAIWARGQDRHRFGTAETLAAVFIDTHLGALAWQHVVDKDHAALVTGNKDAAVGDLLDVDLKAAADP